MNTTVKELTLAQIASIVNACTSYDYALLKEAEDKFSVEQVSTIYGIWEKEVFINRTPKERMLEAVHSKILLL